MNAKLISVAAFAVGAAIGSVATWKIVAVKYEKKTQEEIDSVKEAFSKRQTTEASNELKAAVNSVYGAPVISDIDKLEDMATRIENIARKKGVAEIVDEHGYTNYSDYSKADVNGDEPDEDCDNVEPIYSVREGDKDEPYVIAPEEFGELDGYGTISLTFYADEILADENDNLVECVDSVVGLDSLTTFGDYEDDSVFVRNDKLRCDYEILRDHRRWEDIVSPPKTKTRKTPAKKPHQMEEQ